jgi:NAD-dependent deacetylase
VKLAQYAREFLLVTQNVDDLHARAEREGKHLHKEQIVQIHGDIFITRCSGCDFSRNERDRDVDGLPKCPECGALMRPGVVWFGEQLDVAENHRVENFLREGVCDFALVIGTTATFGYITDWAVRAIKGSGQLIEVNPIETPLSRFATKVIREPAGIALPGLVNAMLSWSQSRVSAVSVRENKKPRSV